MKYKLAIEIENDYRYAEQFKGELTIEFTPTENFKELSMLSDVTIKKITEKVVENTDVSENEKAVKLKWEKVDNSYEIKISLNGDKKFKKSKSYSLLIKYRGKIYDENSMLGLYKSSTTLLTQCEVISNRFKHL